MEVFTIGFTRRTAADFFGTLKRAGVRRLLDIRLNNSSQLAGFAKRDDLPYFLHELGGIAYQHEPLLAPTQDLLDTYRKRRGSWADYERDFLALMHERAIARRLDRAGFATPTVLLCSERTADHCHRRLVVEYLHQHWGGLTITHL